MAAIIRFFEGFALPLIITLSLHAVVILAMLKHWVPELKKAEIKRPNYVQAKLVQLKDVSEQKSKPKNEPKVVDLVKKRQEQERLRKQQEEKRRKLELKRQKEAEAKRKEAERKKKEKLEKEKKAKEKALAEQKKQQQQMEQQAFEQALQAEEQQLLEESYAVAAQSYMSAISQRIEQNWSRPPSARNGMECELLIQLVPTGRVANVDIVRSSGNTLFDRSAVQAVKKAEQFPEIQKMQREVFERYYRELKLIFKPQDLRQ